MNQLKLALVATALTLGTIPAAQAAVGGFDGNWPQPSAPNGLQEARWVCGPYDCRWMPNRWHRHRPHYHRHHHHHRRHWRHW